MQTSLSHTSPHLCRPLSLSLQSPFPLSLSLSPSLGIPTFKISALTYLIPPPLIHWERKIKYKADTTTNIRSLIVSPNSPSFSLLHLSRIHRSDQDQSINQINAMMSSSSIFGLDHLQPEQLCYVHCNFCNTVLAVSTASLPMSPRAERAMAFRHCILLLLAALVSKFFKSEIK